MENETLVPEAFGALRGVKVVSTGTIIAQPFAAVLAAQMGAEVIQVERPKVGWEDAAIFCAELSRREAGTGRGVGGAGRR